MPTTRNSIELLSITMDKLSKLMIRLSGINLYMKKLEMEEEGFIPIGLEGAFENAYDEDEKDSKFSLFKLFFGVVTCACSIQVLIT